MAKPILADRRLLKLSGRKFARWTVVSYLGHGHWKCQCECGVVRPVYRSSLTKGTSKSCGCWGREVTRIRSTTHGCGSVYGNTVTPEYRTWQGIKKRCDNKREKNYQRYGAKGIYVCERWRRSFTDFLADMGKKPSAQHSIDRIDNNGPYSPENCRWATRVQQRRNREDNTVIAHNGTVLLMVEWAELVGLRSRTLHARIFVQKWSMEKALTTPPRNKNGRSRFRGLA